MDEKKPIDWKKVGTIAAQETGRVLLNVAAMFGALVLYGGYAAPKKAE